MKDYIGLGHLDQKPYRPGYIDLPLSQNDPNIDYFVPLKTTLSQH